MTAKKFSPQTILLIPDIHATPSDDLERLRAMRAWLLRRRIALHKIIQIGDLWDFPSLCLHDKDSPEWFTRSLEDDLRAGQNALQEIKQIAEDAKLPDTQIVITLGNHENRYDLFMRSDNRLLTSPFKKSIREYIPSEIRVVDFLKPYIFRGIAFQHYHVSGVMNRPHSGERPALSMLRTHHQSVVQGHKHIIDFAEHTRPDSSKLYAFVCGCFVDPSAKFEFAGAARKLWWNGFHLLHVYRPGEFDIESVSIARL